jgi:hypothetical protein
MYAWNRVLFADICKEGANIKVVVEKKERVRCFGVQKYWN